jgi:hypothetical protein
MISPSEITVIIQGPVPSDLEIQILRIRDALPGAPIIVSTIGQAVPQECSADKVILSEDPGSFWYSNRPSEKLNNVNRQVVTTLSGLRSCSTKYAFKLRSDFNLVGSRFIEFFNKFKQAEHNFRVFEQKVLASCYFSRNPRYSGGSHPFHCSDMVFFGLTSDLINLFDVPLMRVEDQYFWKTSEGWMANRYVPEQHLLVNCLLKNGKRLDFTHQLDTREHNLEQTERYFASNFVFLTWDQFCLIPPGKFDFSNGHGISSIITFYEWVALFKRYVDPDTVLPAVDVERLRIESVQRRNRMVLKLVKLLAMPIFWSSPLRKSTRDNLLNVAKRILSRYFVHSTQSSARQVIEY